MTVLGLRWTSFEFEFFETVCEVIYIPFRLVDASAQTVLHSRIIGLGEHTPCAIDNRPFTVDFRTDVRDFRVEVLMSTTSSEERVQP